MFFNKKQPFSHAASLGCEYFLAWRLARLRHNRGAATRSEHVQLEIQRTHQRVAQTRRTTKPMRKTRRGRDLIQSLCLKPTRRRRPCL